MLNRKLIIGIIILNLISCKVSRSSFTNNMYNAELGNFILFDKKMNYKQRVDKTDSGLVYHVTGDLIKINNYDYLTENETFESALVDSNLNKIKLTEEQKEKIKALLINDTIKFNKNFNELNYNGIIYKKYTK